MAAIDWRRVLTCGSCIGLAWSLMTLPILILFGGDLIDAIPRPLVTVGRLGSFSLNILSGIWAVWLYAAIALRYGAGFKSAAIAGFSWWLIAGIATWQWVEVGFVPARDAALLIGASLPILIVATMVGAWLYRREAVRK
jgi:hypothetical protein